MKFLRAFRKKHQYAAKERAWNRSSRRAELDAERDLPPRPLKDVEEKLLRWILEHGTGEAKSFLPQVEGICAVRSRTCGCPSVRLVPSESVPLGSTTGGRVICDLQGLTRKGELVGVLLFQDAGRLCELEAYSIDGQLTSESQEFEFPIVDTLQELGAPVPPENPNLGR